jgi:hypothetical protein
LKERGSGHDRIIAAMMLPWFQHVHGGRFFYHNTIQRSKSSESWVLLAEIRTCYLETAASQGTIQHGRRRHRPIDLSKQKGMVCLAAEHGLASYTAYGQINKSRSTNERDAAMEITKRWQDCCIDIIDLSK